MAEHRPNILLIVSDDHGYADRSAAGATDLSTPNLDRLAQEGTTLGDAYVTAPICSPSRAGLITGQYQQRWGALWFDNSEIGAAPTMAETLGDAGYETGYFGKVHYGSEDHLDRGAPPQHGFDESFYGLAGQSMGRLHYLHHSEDAQQEYGEAASAMGVQPLWSGTEPVETSGFLTEEIGGRAREFIERDRDRPFFAMVAFNAVHNFCWQLPADELERRGLPAFDDWYPGASEYLDWYDGAVSPNLPNGRDYYVAQLELMDREIGRLLASLDERGDAENTIVVYLTDNGGSSCNYGDNGHLRGTKYTLWEGGVRVPMIVRWPGTAEAGHQVNGVPVSSMDLAATFEAAAGLDPRDELDGIDLRPVLEGNAPERTLHWDCGWQWAVREANLKLTWFDGAHPTAKYVESVEHTKTGDGFTLCDLDADPSENVNLASERPDTVERLTASHARWRESVGLPG